MLSFCLLISFFFLEHCSPVARKITIHQDYSRKFRAMFLFLKPISVCCIYPIEYAIRLSDMKLGPRVDHNPKELRVSTRKSIYSTCESAVR